MKRALTLSALAPLAIAASAQQLAMLHDEWGGMVNGQTVVHWGDNATPNQEVDIVVILNGSSQKTLNVKRYEVAVEANTQNYFCWGVCYAPADAGTHPVWYAEAQHAVTLQPGVGVTNFHAYHSPLGVLGTNVYRYVWYDVANPTDTVWVDIRYETAGVGIDEAAGQTASLNAYPNPAVGAPVQLDVEMAGITGSATLNVYNAVGERVASYALRTGSDRSVLTTHDLPAGMYFASVEVGGTPIATKRLVIASR